MVKRALDRRDEELDEEGSEGSVSAAVSVEVEG